MENRPDTVGSASLAPPYRAVIEGLQAENAALIERNRALERREPEAVVEDLRSRVASLTEHNRRLEHLLRELRRAMFAKKSEKLHPDQLQLAFEALEGALAEAEEAPAASPEPAPRARRPDPRRNLGHLPEHLPRIEQVIEPDTTQCPCGCGEMARIGEDRTERLRRRSGEASASSSRCARSTPAASARKASPRRWRRRTSSRGRCPPKACTCPRAGVEVRRPSSAVSVYVDINISDKMLRTRLCCGGAGSS